MISIKKDNTEIFQISDVDLLLLADSLLDIDSEITRRIQYIIDDKISNCYKRLKDKWDPILTQENAMIPSNRDAYITLITSRQDYQNRSQRGD